MSENITQGQTMPPQHQHQQPGIEEQMDPQPIYDDEEPGYGRLDGKVAVITGGDSGIGRAVAISYAKEGADIVIVYYNEHEDAKKTAEIIAEYGQRALLIATDVADESNCKMVIEKTMEEFGFVDIIVNNAAVQYPQQRVEDITAEQLQRTFSVNIFSQFYFAKHALPHMKEGSCIINTASVTAYKGNPTLLDYSATKGSIVAFTRSLSQLLADKGIRVNAVAPGPVWTPLIPATFPAEKVAEFGADIPMKRPAQPFEIAPAYVFLASSEGAFFTGQVLHPNGGSIVNA